MTSLSWSESISQWLVLAAALNVFLVPVLVPVPFSSFSTNSGNGLFVLASVLTIVVWGRLTSRVASGATRAEMPWCLAGRSGTFST